MMQNQPSLMPAKKNPFNWTEALFVLAVLAILIGIQFYLSRDLHEYRRFFTEAAQLPFASRFAKFNWLRDPGYFMIQNISVSFVPFTFWISFLVSLAWLSKYVFIRSLWPDRAMVICLPYLLVLSFLHEGTQIRVALAIAIAIWAIWACRQRHYRFTILLFALASSLHLSVLILVLPLLMQWAYTRFPKITAMIFILLVFLLMNPAWMNDLIRELGGSLAMERYFLYVNSAVIANQNTSGLYAGFIPFVLVLVLIAWTQYRPESLEQQWFWSYAKMSGVLALAVLSIFQFSVIVSSRLTDLLLFPVVLIIGAVIAQWWGEHKKGYAILLILGLLAYCALRSMVSFGPILTKPLIGN